MRFPRFLMLLPALHLAACGGGGGATGTTTTTTTAATPSSSGTCSLAARQSWAKSVLDEWYLFPETLPAVLDPAPYATVSDYIDALTATARAQRRDRYFTYLTSIAQENAFFGSGASAGFGVRLSTDTAARRVFIIEAFEGAPALAAGIDRGDEIVAIGDSPATLRTVSDIFAASGAAGITDALGPSTAGTTRTLRLSRAGVAREVMVTKADYSLSPVSSRYGAKIIDDGGRRVGYLNLRTFISTADDQLRAAFASFRAAGITQFVIDFRYNGGGLLSTAELMGDLLGGNRASSDVFERVTYRPEKSGQNTLHRFSAQPQSVSPVKIAFIGTGATASASEAVINGMVPFFGANVALVGANSYGKPVGQIAIDKSACDDRLRVIAFALQNGAGSANYYDGLASAVTVTCSAGDDFTRALGDPQEASLRQALDYLAGTPCTPIAATPAGAAARPIGKGPPAPLIPAAPTVPQREVPGLF